MSSPPLRAPWRAARTSVFRATPPPALGFGLLLLFLLLALAAFVGEELDGRCLVFDELDEPVTLLALFVFGYIKGRITGVKALRSAAQTALIGGAAAGAAFGLANWLG